MTEPLYATSPMTIGKHQWRLIVYTSQYYGIVSCFQWRRDGEPWRDQRDWPRYDINDGTWGGMPKTLRTLWLRHQEEIRAALRGEIHAPDQLSLIPTA